MSNEPLFIVVSGPGGAGKSTVVAELVKQDPSLWLSRSWTTRERRPSESVDAYVFVSRDKFEEQIAADGFVEYAEFLGNYYGTPIPAAPDGCDILLEIDVQGARQVIAHTPGALLIFLQAPSAEQQEARLRGRGDPPEKVKQRLDKAAEESTAGRELHAHCIINHQVQRSVDDMLAVINQARKDHSRL